MQPCKDALGMSDAGRCVQLCKLPVYAQMLPVRLLLTNGVGAKNSDPMACFSRLSEKEQGTATRKHRPPTSFSQH
eukprot:295125-Pelagomonas_calceolata.AAC.5